MTTAKLLYTSLFSAFLLAGCDGSQTKISQADQTELTQLREEKKAWASEKAQMQESLTLKEKEKNEAVAELDQLKEEFQRSKHLDADSQEFIVRNIEELIVLIKEIKGEI